jgi:hypothetical protein
MEILGDLLQVRIQFFLDVSTGGQVVIQCPEYDNQKQTLKNTFTKLNINFNL